MSGQEKEQEDAKMAAGFSVPWAKSAAASRPSVAPSVAVTMPELEQQNYIEQVKGVGRRSDNTLGSLLSMVKTFEKGQATGSFPDAIKNGLVDAQAKVAALIQGQSVQSEVRSTQPGSDTPSSSSFNHP